MRQQDRSCRREHSTYGDAFDQGKPRELDYSRPYGRNLSVCPIFAVAVVGRAARLCRDHWFVAMAFPSILGFCASVDRKQKILFREIRTCGVNTDCVSFLENSARLPFLTRPASNEGWFSSVRGCLSRLLWWLRGWAAATPRFCRARSASCRLLWLR